MMMMMMTPADMTDYKFCLARCVDHCCYVRLNAFRIASRD